MFGKSLTPNEIRDLLICVALLVPYAHSNIKAEMVVYLRTILKKVVAEYIFAYNYCQISFERPPHLHCESGHKGQVALNRR